MLKPKGQKPPPIYFTIEEVGMSHLITRKELPRIKKVQKRTLKSSWMVFNFHFSVLVSVEYPGQRPRTQCLNLKIFSFASFVSDWSKVEPYRHGSVYMWYLREQNLQAFWEWDRQRYIYGLIEVCFTCEFGNESRKLIRQVLDFVISLFLYFGFLSFIYLFIFR